MQLRSLPLITQFLLKNFCLIKLKLSPLPLRNSSKCNPLSLSLYFFTGSAYDFSRQQARLGESSGASRPEGGRRRVGLL